MSASPSPGTPARTGQDEVSPQPFRILCVCEGNLCRSPVAAVLLQAALGPEVEVSSAGTGAVVGAPVAPQMQALLRDRSLHADELRARQLRPAHLREADLVLTMTAEQRGQAVLLAPSTVRRSFTLRELARLLAEVDPTLLPPGSVAERFAAAVPAAAARRRQVDAWRDDIADPYGRSDAMFRRAFTEIDDAVERVRAVLRDQSTAGSDSRSAVADHQDDGGTIVRAAASASS